MLTLKSVLTRLNRPEMWLCFSGVALYILSIKFSALGDNPTRFSFAFADLQSFFKGCSIVFGGMCVAVVCTRHSVASAENENTQNSAIYCVRALIALAVVFAVK